jgi:hypothetical protein
MADVRLVVKNDADLQRYVQFFRGLDASMVQYYTVSCCRYSAVGDSTVSCKAGRRRVLQHHVSATVD